MKRHASRIERFGLTLVALLAASAAWARDTVVDLPTRPGVTLRAVYSEPDGGTPIRGAAVGLAGGNGALRIYPNGSMGGGDRSLLVRNRGLLAQQGIATLLVDSPSDKSNVAGWRHTAEHAEDIGVAIQWLRAKTGGPVWLIGHSRGTESAVSAALKLGNAPAGPDGLVLASSILKPSSSAGDNAVTQFPIERLRLPVLVLHHDADDCSVTPPKDLPQLTDKLTGAPRKNVVMLSGGRPIGDQCRPESAHGFGNLNEPFVQAIAQFMFP